MTAIDDDLAGRRQDLVKRIEWERTLVRMERDACHDVVADIHAERTDELIAELLALPEAP